jgi:UDP-galactopyranose mutase
MRITVVGAGLYGLTVAERCAAAGHRVTVYEARQHVGGNAHDHEQDGVRVHTYGPHIFHTSNPRVWDYVTRFTDFNGYRHTVRTDWRGQLLPMPINLATIRAVHGLPDLTGEQARELIAAEAAHAGPPTNLEAAAIGMVGRTLYEALIRDYTAKQWQTDPRDLPAATIRRLPIRYDDTDGYFDDRWQGIPVDGYAAWTERMAEGLDVRLGTPWPGTTSEDLLVWTGPLDAYFGHCHGTLGWRTIVLRRAGAGGTLGHPVINDPSPVGPTRWHEWHHYHPERAHDHPVIHAEYSRWAEPDDEPYYPVNSAADRALAARYRQMAREEPRTILAGRLGSYAYLDMHQAINAALRAADAIGAP